MKTLKLLEKPKDENILFTFHFYELLLLTHQKAHWVPTISQTEDIYYPEAMDYYRIKSLPIGYQGEVVCKAQSQTMGTEFYHRNGNGSGYCCEKCRSDFVTCGESGVIDQAPCRRYLAGSRMWIPYSDSSVSAALSGRIRRWISTYWGTLCTDSRTNC